MAIKKTGHFIHPSGLPYMDDETFDTGVLLPEWASKLYDADLHRIKTWGGVSGWLGKEKTSDRYRSEQYRGDRVLQQVQDALGEGSPNLRWSGTTDLEVVDDGNVVEIIDYKSKQTFDPEQLLKDRNKYSQQLTPYQMMLEQEQGTKPKISTLFVGKPTKRFFDWLIESGRISIDDLDKIHDEMRAVQLANNQKASTSSEWQTEWAQGLAERYADEYKKRHGEELVRQVAYYEADPAPVEDIARKGEHLQKRSQAYQAITGATEKEARRMFREFGDLGDNPETAKFSDMLTLTSRLAYQIAMGNEPEILNPTSAREAINRHYGIMLGGGRTFGEVYETQWRKAKSASGDTKSTISVPTERLIKRKDWTPVPQWGEGVLVNENTGEIVLTYQADEHDYPAVLWRSQIGVISSPDISGFPEDVVTIGGAIISPRTPTIESEMKGDPNKYKPSKQSEDPNDILRNMFGVARSSFELEGGGGDALKFVRSHINETLSGMPSAGGGGKIRLLSKTPTQLAYERRSVSIGNRRFRVQQLIDVFGKGEKPLAIGKSGNVAFDPSGLGPYHLTDDPNVVMTGGVSPGKFEKRLSMAKHDLTLAIRPRRGQRVPDDIPADDLRKWREEEFRHELDRKRNVLSPFVSRGEATEGAALLQRANTVLLTGGNPLPEGMAYVSHKSDIRMQGVPLHERIEFPHLVGFERHEGGKVERVEGGFSIGTLSGGQHVVVPADESVSQLVGEPEITFSDRGDRSVIEFEGIGAVIDEQTMKFWRGMNKAMGSGLDLEKHLNLSEEAALRPGEIDVLGSAGKVPIDVVMGILGAEYASRETELAQAIYGDDADQHFLFEDQYTPREQYIAEMLGIDDETREGGVLMPRTEEHWRNFDALAREVLAKYHRDDIELTDIPMTDLDLALLRRGEADITKTVIDEESGLNLVSLRTSGFVAPTLVGAGQEIHGKTPSMSLEEVRRMMESSWVHGEGYKEALESTVLPGISERSERIRRLYRDIALARGATTGELRFNLEDDDVITFDELKRQVGSVTRDNFAQRVADVAPNKFIVESREALRNYNIPNLVLPTGETLSALASQPEQFFQHIFWEDEETRDEQETQLRGEIDELTHALFDQVIGGKDRTRLWKAFVGPGEDGEKSGLAMNKAVQAGLTRFDLRDAGADERAAVAYYGIQPSSVVMDDRTLMKLFGVKDARTVNRILEDVREIIGVRRPVTDPTADFIPANIMTVNEAIDSGVSIPENFRGVAMSQFMMARMQGDYDADRFLAVLAARMDKVRDEETGKASRRFVGDPAISKAAETQGFYWSWIQSMNRVLGYDISDLEKELGTELEEGNITPDDILDLNELVGSDYSEVENKRGDIRQRGFNWEDVYANFARKTVSLRKMVSNISNVAAGKALIPPVYNKLIRSTRMYAEHIGESDLDDEEIAGFLAYQSSVDLTKIPRATCEILEIWETYDPNRRGEEGQVGPTLRHTLSESFGGKTRGEYLPAKELGPRLLSSILDPEGLLNAGENAKTIRRRMLAAFDIEKLFKMSSSHEGAKALLDYLSGGQIDPSGIWESMGETDKERFGLLAEAPGFIAGPVLADIMNRIQNNRHGLKTEDARWIEDAALDSFNDLLVASSKMEAGVKTMGAYKDTNWLRKVVRTFDTWRERDEGSQYSLVDTVLGYLQPGVSREESSSSLGGVTGHAI